MNSLPFGRPPDFINEDGVKWWIDKELTEYARMDLNAVVFFVEKPNGYQTRALVIDGAVQYESQSLEAMGCRIDLLKAAAQFDKKT